MRFCDFKFQQTVIEHIPLGRTHFLKIILPHRQFLRQGKTSILICLKCLMHCLLRIIRGHCNRFFFMIKNAEFRSGYRDNLTVMRILLY